MSGARRAVVAALLACALPATAWAADPSPIGYWKMVDDKTGAPAGFIEIAPAGDGLVGRIVSRGSVPGGQECKTCDDDDVGQTILTGFRHDGDRWDDGTIRDPRTGFEYSSELQVVDEGKKLRVRGYLGIPLLGKTTTWLRAD